MKTLTSSEFEKIAETNGYVDTKSLADYLGVTLVYWRAMNAREKFLEPVKLTDYILRWKSAEVVELKRKLTEGGVLPLHKVAYNLSDPAIPDSAMATTAECASFFGITPRTWITLTKAGKVPQPRQVGRFQPRWNVGEVRALGKLNINEDELNKE